MGDRYLAVHVTPRARTEAVIVEDGAVRVSVSAPADKGAANAAVLALLAAALGVPKVAVRIVTGETARRKLVAVAGMDAEEALARLRAHDVEWRKR